MKYNFDTILKEFKPKKEEVEETKDIYDYMFYASIVLFILIISMDILL